MTVNSPEKVRTALERILTLTKLMPNLSRIEPNLTDNGTRNVMFFSPCSLYLKNEENTLCRLLILRLEVRFLESES